MKKRTRDEEIESLNKAKKEYQLNLKHEQDIGRSPLLIGTYKRWLARIDERLIELNASEK